MTGLSVPRPKGRGVAKAGRRGNEGDEIVRARWKHRDHANPLVPGSSPGGPTKKNSRLMTAGAVAVEEVAGGEAAGIVKNAGLYPQKVRGNLE